MGHAPNSGRSPALCGSATAPFPAILRRALLPPPAVGRTPALGAASGGRWRRVPAARQPLRRTSTVGAAGRCLACFARARRGEGRDKGRAAASLWWWRRQLLAASWARGCEAKPASLRRRRLPPPVRCTTGCRCTTASTLPPAMARLPTRCIFARSCRSPATTRRRKKAGRAGGWIRAERTGRVSEGWGDPTRMGAWHGMAWHWEPACRRRPLKLELHQAHRCRAASSAFQGSPTDPGSRGAAVSLREGEKLICDRNRRAGLPRSRVMCRQNV